jgi:hypothetical protein
MYPRYLLSNRQLKEINRGNTIQVALPEPPICDSWEPSDFLDWDHEAMEGVSELIVKVEKCAVEVSVALQPSKSKPSLQGLFGMIVSVRIFDCSDWLFLSVNVVVVTIRERTGGAIYPVQWPGNVRLRRGLVL